LGPAGNREFLVWLDRGMLLAKEDLESKVEKALAMQPVRKDSI
jgi:hypothetical protein